MGPITIFAVPKCFEGLFATIQYNAIRSWLQLKPRPEVILCGNDAGVAEAAKELGVIHIPDVEVSEWGTPLLSSIFAEVHRICKHPILAYINCDIILTHEFLRAIKVIADVHPHQFVIVGQRHDLRVRRPIDFSNPRWEVKLRKRVTKYGKLHSPCGVDYYIFRKGMGLDMPPFIAGRPAWDNWFLSQALQNNFGVIDATDKILAIHQKHNYSHAGGEENARHGIEAEVNRKLAGGDRVYIDNASWTFVKGKLVKKSLGCFLITWTNTDTGKRSNLLEITAYDRIDAKRKAAGSNRRITKIEELESRAFEKGAFQLELKRIDTEELEYVTYIAFNEGDARAAWRMRGRNITTWRGHLCLVTAVKRMKMHKKMLVL